MVRGKFRACKKVIGVFILEIEYGEPNKTLIIGLNLVVFDGTLHFFRKNAEECGIPQFRLSVFDQKNCNFFRPIKRYEVILFDLITKKSTFQRIKSPYG